MRVLPERILQGHTDKYLGLLRVGMQAGFRVLLGILIARLAGPTVFATFVQLVTLEIVAHTLWTAAFVTPLGSLGPGLPAAERGAFLRFALTRNRRAAVRTGLALALGTPVAVALGIDAVVWLGFSASTVAWLEANAAIGALAATFRSGRAVIATAAGFGVPTTAVILAHGSPASLLPTFFWANAIGHAGAAMWMRRALPAAIGSAEVSGATRSSFQRFGRVSIVGSVANSACTRVQPFVLAAAVDALAVGLYGAANTLAGPVRVVGGALGEVLRPRLALHLGADGEPERAKRAFGRAVLGVVGMGIVMLVIVVTAGDAVAKLVFGPRFVGLGAVLPAAAGFVLLATLAHVMVVAMQTADPAGPAHATRWRVRAAALSLALVWPACGLGGAKGAFLAMAAAEAVFLIASFRWLRGRSPLLRGSSPHVPVMVGGT